MKLKLRQIKVDVIYKVLVIDEEEHRYGKLVTFFESKDPNEAMIDAVHFCEASRFTTKESVWN